MAHTVEWKVRLHLFEGEGTTGTTELTGHGAAHRNPVDTDVPEIGDELAAGRAMRDLGRQLVGAAQRDIEGMGAGETERWARPETGWPMPEQQQGR